MSMNKETQPPADEPAEHKLLQFAKDHYWGELTDQKDLIIQHLEGILTLIALEPAQPPEPMEFVKDVQGMMKYLPITEAAGLDLAKQYKNKMVEALSIIAAQQARIGELEGAINQALPSISSAMGNYNDARYIDIEVLYDVLKGK